MWLSSSPNGQGKYTTFSLLPKGLWDSVLGGFGILETGSNCYKPCPPTSHLQCILRKTFWLQEGEGTGGLVSKQPTGKFCSRKFSVGLTSESKP